MASMQADGRLRDELQAEYLLLQNQYEAYDQRALSLKGLATPLLGAGVAFGLTQPSPVLIGLTVALTAALWALETTWKVFQYCNVQRIERLEAWFADDASSDPKPFQVYSAWAQAWEGWKSSPQRWLAVAVEPFVCLPYIVVVGAGVVAALVVYAGRH